MENENVHTLVCATCGSKKVEIQAWVDINTNEYISDVGNDIYYCSSCQKEVQIVEEDEYNNKKS